MDALHDHFRSESDRAAAIVASSMLDNALATLLRKFLVVAVSKERSVLDSDRAPLGTFSARIDAAFQCGLMSKFMAADLHLIRKIRNEFAHDPLHMSFDTPVVKNRVLALEARSNLNTRDPETRKNVGPPGVRWDFLGMAAWMLYALHRSVDDIKPREPHGPEFGYVNYREMDADIRKALEHIDRQAAEIEKEAT